VIASRRAMPARHEFRVGNRELMMFAAVFVVICALTFVFGILVGREMAPAPRAAAVGEGEGADSRSGAAAPPGSQRGLAKAEEHLTFYKTLTAPTLDLPPAGKPRIEERLVPSDDSPAAAPAPAPAPGPGASGGSVPAERRSPAASARPTPPVRPSASPPRTATRAPTVGAPLSPAPSPASSPVATFQPAPSSVEPPLWTVQVSAFRSRTLAEDLRARLAARGLDAYVVSSATEGGQVRFRVRVGTYASRADAERVAAELRAERTMTPYVTPRDR
jgi:cell division septation protein DedD